ncbi:MAG: hypothetical protein COA97_08610 [Flavobacteriales bacterium]|nr:MAG: hypothetical protein COA97_08610 [Flavobacteriales bacterium]
MEVSKVKLRYRDRDTMFKKEYSELKIKVALNWFEIFALITVSSLLSFKMISYMNLGNIFIPIITSLGVALITTYLFCRFRNYQLNITRFDKEDIYKKISNDLIDKVKA